MPQRWAALLVLLVASALLAGACDSPPQVLEITPSRGAVDVRSSEAIRIRFDRPMDRRSVVDRFHVEPRVQGALDWTSDHELEFEHVPFSPSSQYRVILEPGYRDADGSANSLRHSWTFRTEPAPTLASSTPGAGDRGVDPAAYISLSFSREMDLGTLTGAVSLTPAAPFVIHPDPGEPRRVVLAPQSLLVPRTSYQVAVGQDARDVDGNRLGAAATVAFSTGDFRPLRHWVSFIAEASPGSGGGGLWIVDDNRLPRRLINGAVTSFAWSADGSHVLLRGPDGTWSDQSLDGASTQLPISGDWAAFLAPGRGYAFLDRGTLQLLEPDGRRVTVAIGVNEAAVAPGGARLAFALRDLSGVERTTEIDGYNADLRARYRLQTEPGLVDGLAWSPDSQSLAYRLDAGGAAQQRQIRVRSLRDGSTVTAVTGDVSVPQWQADRQHVVVTAAVPTSAGTMTKAFRFAVGDGIRHRLSAAAGLPSGPGVQVDQLSPSPDGHQLAFVSSAGGRPGVWTMNADGTGASQLTQSNPDSFPYSCRDVAWTPS